MAGAFDATMKQLVDAFAADWVGALAPLVGLPADLIVESLDADLSTVQPAVDKVFRILPPNRGLLHLEAQASWDGDFPNRLLFYNVLLEHRYGGPVHTVVLLLRRDASAPNLTGTLSRCHGTGTEYLRFSYAIIRLWELPVEGLFAEGIGASLLALLTDEAAPRLPEFVNRFAERVEQECENREDRNLLLTCGFILLGLRYDKEVIRALFKGVQQMRESSTYQSILDEGRDKGRVEGVVAARQEDLLALLEERFGSVPRQTEVRIRGCLDPLRLQAAIRKVLHLSSPDDIEL